MPEPFAGDEDRTPDVEAEGVVLERRAVPFAHQEADQAGVGVVQLLLATREGDARRVRHREVACHRVVEADEAVVEHVDSDRSLRGIVGDNVSGDTVFGNSHVEHIVKIRSAIAHSERSTGALLGG